MNSPILVFDLGDVLYEVDYNKSLEKFKALAAIPFNPEPSEFFYLDLFNRFETGSLSEKAFRNEIRELLGSNPLDEEIDLAWNSMLQGVKNRRMADLVKLKKEYPLFLLSNTNPIHYRKLESECPGLFSLFDRSFFSFEMGIRKPSPAIYEKAAHLGEFSLKNAWMIDDRNENIEGAKLSGMKVFQVRNQADWEGLMKLLAPQLVNKY